MALTTENDNIDKKRDSHKGAEKKEKLPSKVIIRRLPPNMDQTTFLNQIAPVPHYDYLYMVKGDASLGENSFSRVYISFSNPNDIYDFREKFDNYVFLNSAGHEYPAVVEFAAFQKIPKRRNKVRVDPKVSTIETDPYYIEFVEMINKPPEQDEKPEYSYQITDSNKNDENESTPLLEFVKNRRAEKMRIREERREERKRKEFERKKFREDERKKRFEDKSPIKNTKPFQKVLAPAEADKNVTEEVEKVTKKVTENSTEKDESLGAYYKNKERKFERKKENKVGKFTPKKEYVDKREYKPRREDFRDYNKDYRTTKYDDGKKEESKGFSKKVKKYSEKREERKIEAQKAEQKKLELQATKSEEVKINDDDNPASTSKSDDFSKESKIAIEDDKIKDNNSKRIRNKDRPTIAIYRPGMLSKRKQNEEQDVKKD